MRPDLVAEITLQPVRRYGVDAAILYSDIMVPLQAVGVDLDIVAGTGPVIAHPISTAADLAQLRDLEPAAVEHVSAAVSILVHELNGVPLIGFAGAPFTLASYLVEGGPSRDYAKTKALMVSEPDGVAHALHPAGRHLRRLPRGAGCGRCGGGPALRLLGGVVEPRRLRPVRSAVLHPAAHPAGVGRRAADPLRRRDR